MLNNVPQFSEILTPLSQDSVSLSTVGNEPEGILGNRDLHSRFLP
jgi:hypothetical protein